MRYEVKINSKRSYLYNEFHLDAAIAFATANSLTVYDRKNKRQIYPFKKGWKSFLKRGK